MFCHLSSETTENEVDDINKPSSSRSTKDADKINVYSDLPDCWSTKQADEFKEKYGSLLIIGKKLGCDICAKVESVNMKAAHVSKAAHVQRNGEAVVSFQVKKVK